MAQDNGLLIAALVAIVAVVGLVILFSGANTTGAAVAPGDVTCPPGYAVKNFVGAAGKLSYVVCEQVAFPGIPASLY